MSSINIYPTYVMKSFIIPYYVESENKPKYVKRFNPAEREELYNKTKTLMKNLVNYYLKMKHNNDKTKKITDLNDLNNILNLYALLTRNILYRNIEGEIIPSASNMYIGCYILRKIKGEKITPLYKKGYIYLKDYTDKCYNAYKSFVNSVKKNLDKELDVLVKSLLEYPADTRIGMSTSSLLLHSFAVSGLAIVLYKGLTENTSIEDETALRLISLFHDIGKLLNFKGEIHEKLSASFIDEIFKETTEHDSNVYKLIINVMNYLVDKPSKYQDLMNKYFRRADRIAAGVDRIEHLIPIYLSKASKLELSKYMSSYLKAEYSFEDGLKKVINDWRFWETLISDIGFEKYSSYLEEFSKNASKIGDKVVSSSKLVPNDLKSYIKSIGLARLDIRGIQNYIKSTKLSGLVGGSFIIDLIIFGAFYDYIMDSKDQLYPENILLFGGGNISLIIPYNEKYINNITTFAKYIKKTYHVNILSVVAKWDLNLKNMFDELDEKTLIAKLTNVEAYPIPELSEKCDLCGEENAIDYRYKYKLGVRCKIKFSVAIPLHFNAKLTRLLKHNIFNIGKTEEPFDYMKIIAEANVSESPFKVKEAMNISIVKFDGNMIGALMSTSISLTDLFERSIRIDSSVKKAIEDFLSIVRKVNPSIYNAILLGILYVGGDDGLILMPSFISPIFALYLLNKYYKYMGGKSSLSLAIISHKYKHPIYHLHLAVNTLLDEIVKSNLIQRIPNLNSRMLTWRYLYNKIIEEYSDEYRGSIGFYSSDVGLITSLNITHILINLESSKTSIQALTPYILAKEEIKRSILNPLNTILSKFDQSFILGDPEEISDEWVKKVLKYISKEISLLVDNGEGFKELKSFKRNILKSIEIEYAEDIKARFVWVLSKKLFSSEDILRILYTEEDFHFVISDILMLIKLFGGGLGGL